MDCGTRPPAVIVPRVTAPGFTTASLEPGVSPPTRLVTFTAVPLLASVRNVCTGTHVVHAAPPVRAERTEPFTTRTITDTAEAPVSKE